MEIASPGQCDIHLVHAEEDVLATGTLVLCIASGTLVAKSDEWMDPDKHKYWHWLHCSLPHGRCLLSELKLSHPEVIPLRDRVAVARLSTPTKFHVEGFSAGSYTGATIVIALCHLFPTCPVSATLGAIAMPKGIMGALMELASPGRCDIHLVHAEEDLLCDWHPSPTDRKAIEYRLRCTLVAEADKWMGADKHRYWHWLHCSLPEGRWLLSELKLSHPDVIPIRDRMAAPLRLASWIRFETVMNQQDWRTAIEQLVPQIHLPDPALLDLLRSCVPEQGFSSMAEAQAILLRNFRVGSSEPNACEQWLTEVTRDLFKPIPFREVFVILALFLPQLTFAEGAKLDCKLWYSPAISNELSTIHVTPIAQGLQGMHEYKIAFTPNSRAAAFVSPEQPTQSFESLATLPSEQIHIGSQVGRVYRLVLREGNDVFALLVVLLEYVTQPKKKSRLGSLESKEELAIRQSSPRSWTVAYIPTPEAFAPLPTAAEAVVNTPSLQQLEVQTVGLPILSLAEVGTTVSALQMATMPLEHKPTARTHFQSHTNSKGLKSSYIAHMHSSVSWQRPIPRGIVPRPVASASNCVLQLVQTALILCLLPCPWSQLCNPVDPLWP